MNIVKVAIIGVNAANIQEIQNIVVDTIGDNAEIIRVTINHYKEITNADLYVCLINRKQEVEKVFGIEKVVALTLVPPTVYFLEISKIPANQTVVIFNNS